MENIKLEDIKVYPTTQIHNKEITVKQYLEKLSEYLINEWYYDRRFDSKNLDKLFKYTIQKMKIEGK